MAIKVALIAVCLIFALDSVASDKSIDAVVEEHIKDNAIAVFAKSYCPHCKRVRELFNSMGVKANFLDMDTELPTKMSAIQDELMKRVGRRTVPQVFIK